MNFKYLFLVFILASFSSCEERMVTIPDFVAPETDKVVLLEELTGVRCPGCPAGALEIQRLGNVYGDNFVAVSYYTDFLGFPLEESQYDFRSAEAQSTEDRLGLYRAKPAATFNRKQLDPETRFNTSQGEWLGLAEAELVGFSPILMSGTSSYDSGNKEAAISITISPKDVFTGTHNLVVLITESHIIDAQLHPMGEIREDYEHNHVFRKLLSDIEGVALPQTIGALEELQYDFSVTLEDEWNPDNIEVVAFVELQENGAPKEVIQAFEMHLIQ